MRRMVGLALIASLMATTTMAAPAKPAPKPAPKAAAKPAPKASAKAHPKPAPKPVDYTVSPTGDLARVDLLKIMAGRLKNPKQDAFTGEPTARHSGRHFVFHQTLERDDGESYGETSARWSYDVDSQTLILTLEEPYGLEFTSTDSPAGSYVGSNAYGVKKSVRLIRRTEGQISPDYGAAWASHVAEALKTKIKIAPEEARALTRNLILRIEGDLQAKDGVLTDCESIDIGATIDDPVAVEGLSCSIRALINRLAFVDARNDKVYAEWLGNHANATPPRNWIRLPSADDLTRFFPDRAMRESVSGETMMSCVITEAGKPEDCAVISESPAGYGFGDAALKASVLMRMTPGPRQTGVNIPLKWRLPT